MPVIFKKRIFELKIGDKFHFSGGLRTVIDIDDEHLWFANQFSGSLNGHMYKQHAQTIRKNSKMIVQTEE